MVLWHYLDLENKVNDNELILFPLDNSIFSSSEDDIVVAPITHVSVTLDGIPEVMETQQVQETCAHSPGASSPEQPKRKKGGWVLGLGHTVLTWCGI